MNGMTSAVSGSCNIQPEARETERAREKKEAREGEMKGWRVHTESEMRAKSCADVFLKSSAAIIQIDTNIPPHAG